MPASIGGEDLASCRSCKLPAGQFLCNVAAPNAPTPESEKPAQEYGKGEVLFAEGESAQGVFVLCKGRVKVLLCTGQGESVILKIAEPGELLGLSAAVSGKPYGTTAETTESCQAHFVPREAFLQLIRGKPELCLWVARQLSANCDGARNELRLLHLSHSAAGRLAQLLLQWSAKKRWAPNQPPFLSLALTQRQIGQMIGLRRETVSRLFAELERQSAIEVVQAKGSVLRIRDSSLLRRIARG